MTDIPKKTKGRPLSEYNKQVLAYLKKHGPSTAKQIHEGLGFEWVTGAKHTRIRTALESLCSKGQAVAVPMQYKLPDD